MAETGDVAVPGMGKVPKKEATIGLVVVVTLVVVYYYKKKSSASSAPAATATSQYPPDGTVGNPSDPYSTDPATGQTYGNEAAGSGGTFGAYGSYSGGASGSGSGSGSDGDGDGESGGGLNDGSGSGSGGPPFSSNSEWSNWTIQQMQATDPAVNVGALTSAIGLYLAGQPVDPAQKQLVFNAIAIGGNPPVAGANGYPPNVRTNGSKGGGGGGGKGGKTARVPVTYGMRATQAVQAVEAAGFRAVTSPLRNPRDEYVSTGETPMGGKDAPVGSLVTIGVRQIHPKTTKKA